MFGDKINGRMEPGLNDLRRQLSSTDVYEVLSARRAGPNELERIMHLVPYPKDIDVKNPLPEWQRLPLCSKIPLVRAPKDFIIVTRGKLGETVRRQGDTFDIADPLNYNLRIDYDPIHDKHLRHYFFSPGNKKLIDDMGLLTKDNAVKCDLKEYNAYRRYVYNVHKNSVLNALRGVEEVNQDKAVARNFMEDALAMRELQFKEEDKEKQAVMRAAYRKLIRICEKLLCETRMKRFDKIQENKAKEKERQAIRLLVSQKKFGESLENYRIKSHDVAWKRNIRAQKKWRKVMEADEYRKSVNAQVDRIGKLLQVIEAWIQKDVQQVTTRERDTNIWKAFKNYSAQRKAARERNFKLIHTKNIARLQEIKRHGPTPKEVLQEEENCNYVGDVLAGFRKMKPDMKRCKPVVSIVNQTLKMAIDSGDRTSKRYFGTNLMSSRKTSEVAENIMSCVYRRALVMYIKNAVYRYLPVLITELKHVIVLFEEDISRKEFSVDEIRRLVRSYIGSRKRNMYETPDYYTTFGFIGKLKDKVYKTSKRRACRCPSYCDIRTHSSNRKVKFELRPSSMLKEAPKDRRVSFSFIGELKKATKCKKKYGEDKHKKKMSQKQTYSILRKCPVRREMVSERNATTIKGHNICCMVPVSDVCSCNKEVCTCTKEVNRVKFAVPEASSELLVKSPDSVVDNSGGKRVTFAEKPTTIYMPQEVRTSCILQYVEPNAVETQQKGRAKKGTSFSVDDYSTGGISLERKHKIAKGDESMRTVYLNDDKLYEEDELSKTVTIESKIKADQKAAMKKRRKSSAKTRFTVDDIAEFLSSAEEPQQEEVNEKVKKSQIPREESNLSFVSSSSSSHARIFSGEINNFDDLDGHKVLKNSKGENTLDGNGRKIRNETPGLLNGIEDSLSFPNVRNKVQNLYRIQKGTGGFPNLSAFDKIVLNNEDKKIFSAINPKKKGLPLLKDINTGKTDTVLFYKMMEPNINEETNQSMELRKSDNDSFCHRRLQRDKDEQTKHFIRKYKPPNFSLQSEYNVDDYSQEISKSLKHQYFISEKDENVQNMEAPITAPNESEHGLSKINDVEEGQENLYREGSKFQQSAYSTGDKPRGVTLGNCRTKPKCDLQKIKNLQDRKVFAHFPTGKPEPKYGALCNLKQVFEPTYRPIYSPDLVGRMYGEPQVKSILKKTSYCPAQNCTLVHKYLKHYKFKSVEDLKDFIILRTTLNTSEALAASKTDKKYGETFFADPTKHNKAQVQGINIDALSKYSYDVVPINSEACKKLISSGHSTAQNDKNATFLPPGIHDADQMTELDETKDHMSFILDPVEQFSRHHEHSASMTKLVAEAIPEVNDVFMEFYNRNEPQAIERHSPRPKVHNAPSKTMKATRQVPAVKGAMLKTPQDVIRASFSFTGRDIAVDEEFPVCGRHQKNMVPQFLKKYEKAGRENLNSERSLVSSGSESSVSESSTSISGSELSVPEVGKFNILSKVKPKATEATLCGICGVCTHTLSDGPEKPEDYLSKILKCSNCGRCIHEAPIQSASLRKIRKWEKEKRHDEVVKQNNKTDEEDDEGIRFLNGAEVKKYYFYKKRKENQANADLRAILGHEFDPNKFVYFVDKNNEYLCWKDLFRLRYPLRPFPWDTTKLERLTKRKLPVEDLKSYTYPSVIFQAKAAKGYKNWEASRKEELEGGVSEMKWNSVPPKFAKLFSTTVKPANRPAKQLKSIKSRRPTPYPSMTDLVTRIMEESRGNLYDAKDKLKQDKTIFSMMKTKINSTVRIMMNILTVICILKMKKGYPDMNKMISKKEKNYYYVPLKRDRHSAKKLVKGFSEFVLCHGVKHMHYASLEPMADIILMYAIDPDKYPLFFPENGDDILLSDTDETEYEAVGQPSESNSKENDWKYIR